MNVEMRSKRINEWSETTRIREQADVVVEEVSSGIFKVIKDRGGIFHPYLKSDEVVELLNSSFVRSAVIADRYAITANFIIDEKSDE